MKRGAKAIWNGSVKEGNGKLTTDSKVLDSTSYSFHTRFEDGKGTNPEELIGAAHAGCFAMQLSAFLTEEDCEPKELDADCQVTFEDGEVKKSHIVLKADVPGIQQEKFDQLVEKAKVNCPISKLLDTEISVEATLK